MTTVKPGDKLRIKKDFFSLYAPNGKYSVGDIVEVESLVHEGYITPNGEILHYNWHFFSEYFELVEEEKTMTPCECLGYKVGDAFVAPYDLLGVKKGDIIYLQEDSGSNFAYFGKNKNQQFPDVCFRIEHKYEGYVAKPYKPQTAAEKRGAKFGVSGVIKETGEKVVFQREQDGQWLLFSQTSAIHRLHKPSEICLDHEPEYKEIPFEEATHDQRMNVDNLVHISREKVTEIFQFKNGCYAYTVEENEPFIRAITVDLKVRVPV